MNSEMQKRLSQDRQVFTLVGGWVAEVGCWAEILVRNTGLPLDLRYKPTNGINWFCQSNLQHHVVLCHVSNFAFCAFGKGSKKRSKIGPIEGGDKLKGSDNMKVHESKPLWVVARLSRDVVHKAVLNKGAMAPTQIPLKCQTSQSFGTSLPSVSQM